MKTKKHPPIPAIVLIVLLLAAGGYYGIRALLNQGDAGLYGSGTVEAVSVTISPEIGGKVAEVRVAEGDEVRRGDVLFTLDGNVFNAQREVTFAAVGTAEAALAAANENYALVLDAAQAESLALRGADWRAVQPAEVDLPAWYFDQGEEIRAAQNEVDSALLAHGSARKALDDLLKDPANAQAAEAETRLANARAAMLVAQDVLTRASVAVNPGELRTAAQEAVDGARQELQEAQDAYDAMQTESGAQKIAAARQTLALAQARLDAAQDRLLALQYGLYSPRLNAARLAVEQAEKSVAQAQANLVLLDTQQARLTIVSPVDGVVLSMNIHAGEVIAAGGHALSIGQLDDLSITVYVPEDRYGVLTIGQRAEVQVDSFPEKTFSATITQISDQAEFTPRNVQTVEGRSSTVYAIRLRLDDPSRLLKPGMPADVIFLNGE